MKTTSFLDLKKDFPIFQNKQKGQPLIYLDTAATAHKPLVMIEAISDFYSNTYGSIHRGVYSLSCDSTQSYHGVRKIVKNLISCSKVEEVVFTKGATHSLNIVARGVLEAIVPKGGVVLVSDIEHHSNFVPWVVLCSKYGCKLKVFKTSSTGEVILEEIEEILKKERVYFLSLAHVTNVFGSIFPIKDITRLAHQYGALVGLDASQSIAHMPVDVLDLDVDFCSFSGHKIYGPTGVGVLYGKTDLLEKIPPMEFGGDMVNKVSLNEIIYKGLPSKFEGGTPSIASVIGLGASLNYVLQLGLQEIFLREREILSSMKEQLESIEGLVSYGPNDPLNRGSLLSFYIEDVHSMDVALFLDNRGIALRSGNLCNQMSLRKIEKRSVLRASLGVYNTTEDINTFVLALQEIVSFLRKQ